MAKTIYMLYLKVYDIINPNNNVNPKSITAMLNTRMLCAPVLGTPNIFLYLHKLTIIGYILCRKNGKCNFE